MPKQIVMDRTGDTQHVFDPADQVSLAEAEKRFKELTGLGFTAATRQEPGGKAAVTRSFDPNAAETLFIPQLQGG